VVHTIEFVTDVCAEREGGGQPVERVLLRRGTRLRVGVRPRLVQGRYGPVEAADLTFEDGTVVRRMPFAHFAFPD
jgi:hypothetical protein